MGIQNSPASSILGVQLPSRHQPASPRRTRVSNTSGKLPHEPDWSSLKSPCDAVVTGRGRSPE
jgi:hypothetical protein